MVRAMSETPSHYHAGSGPLELPGLEVILDALEHHPELPAEKERPFPFVYFITIRNHSDRAVTLTKRKWVVTDAGNDKIVVEGDGIVGQKPRLEPGDEFSYNSYHIIGTDSVAEGSYHGVDDEGNRIFTRIPRFELIAPRLA
jgi:ApaG protein